MIADEEGKVKWGRKDETRIRSPVWGLAEARLCGGVCGCRPTADQITPLVALQKGVDWNRLHSNRRERSLKRWKSVKVVYIPFYVREIFTFFLRMLSMYLTFTDLHFPSFRAFCTFWWQSRILSRLQGKDETTIKTALLFVPVRVAVPEVSYNKVPPFQKMFRSA